MSKRPRGKAEIALSARTATCADLEPMILRVTRRPDLHPLMRSRSVLIAENPTSGFPASLTTAAGPFESSDSFVATLPEELAYLEEGDVVRISPVSGEVRVMFRVSSKHNSVFVTERCNSNCLMCSQPPRAVNDDHLIDEWLEAMPLLPRDHQQLGVTGGEPGMLGRRLVQLLRSALNWMPSCHIDVLSNGRYHGTTTLAESLAQLPGIERVLFTVPLYGSTGRRHDWVVNSSGAFEETIQGLLNMYKAGIRCEIRVVLHAQTAPVLPEIAEFVRVNLPFVERVAFMGMEHVGFALANYDDLKIDPVDYQANLEDAARTLEMGGVPALIYNLPHCVLTEENRPRAVKSISDWKNSFPDACTGCPMKADCCGVFSWGEIERSRLFGAW